MKVRFTRDIIIFEHCNIDCFAGHHDVAENRFKAGDEIEIAEIERGEKRRHAPRLNTLYRPTKYTHADRLLDVPEDAYEELT